MEGAPGSPSGPPQAKRPRLEEDAPWGPQSRGRAPEEGPASTEAPRPQRALPAPPLNLLPLHAPLLGGPPMGEQTIARGQEGARQGGAPPKRRHAPGGPRGFEESPSPKAPRSAPAEEGGARRLGGADRGRLRPLGTRGGGGAPAAPRACHERELMENLPSPQPATGLGRARGAMPADARAGNSRGPVLEKALVRSGACPAPAVLGAAEMGGGAQGPRWRPPATRAALVTRAASPATWAASPARRLLRAVSAGLFHPFAHVPGSQKDDGIPAWFGGREILQPERRRAGHVNARSESDEARARPWGPRHVKLAARSPPAPLVSSSGFLAAVEVEFILEEENKLKCIRLLRLGFHVNNTSEKHDAPLLLIAAFVSIWRDARNALLRSRRGLALPSKDRDIGQCYMGSLKIDMYFLNGILVSTQQKEFLKGSYRTSRFLPITGRFLEGNNNLFTVFEMHNLTGLGFESLPYLNEIPKWKVRKLKNDNNSDFLKEEKGNKSVVPEKRRCNTVQGNNLLLTTFKTSNSAFYLNMRYEHNKVRQCMNRKEGNHVPKVTGTCHIITTENIHRDFKKHGSNSFHVIPKDTLFPVFDTFEKVPLLSNFGDTGNISLSKRDSNNNASSEKAISLEVLNIRDIPQFIQDSQTNTTEHVHKTNANSQDTVIEKKQMFNINSFSFKVKFNSFLDIEQEVKLVNCDTIYIGPNAMTKTQEEFVGDFLSEGKEKIQNLIWNERKHPTESLTEVHSYQISNGSKIEREQKCSITTTNTFLKSNLLMKKKSNLEDAREINQIQGNQNNTADRIEHQSLLQESALANSKLLHPSNDFTEFVNREFKTDLATRKNEYSPDLGAECLSTETKTMSDFEMKSKFDIVLKELCMFCEIGKEEETFANSRLFHPKNESTEFNHKLKTDLMTRNNECSPNITAECLSTETKTMGDFEMKSEFDIVLKELRVFHEIGKEEETSCIGETRNNEEKNDSDKDNSTEEVHQDIKEDLTVVSLEKICAPSLPCDTVTSVNMPKTARSSFKWKKIHMDHEKEVPHECYSSSPSDEELLHSPGGGFEKAFSQNSAFFSDAFMEGRIHSLLKGGSGLSHGIVRVYPLKTCRGPIRIGLSRKAKPKQLHPYLK